MRMLMIIVESSCREELEVLLNKDEVLGYSEISQEHGVGKTGPLKEIACVNRVSGVVPPSGLHR